MKSSMNIPQRIKNRSTISSSNYAAGYLPKGNKISVLKRYLHPCNHNSLDNGSNLSVHQQMMDKAFVVCVYQETLFIHKHKEILPFVTTRMDFEGIMLSAISQKCKYHMISLICGIYKKTQIEINSWFQCKGVGSGQNR